MTQQRYLIALCIILTISTAYFWFQMFAFPVKYVSCNASHENCSVRARFNTIDHCKRIEERANWYCNDTDKQNITCKVGVSPIVATYCSD
jgi:hypothetical protein